MLCYAVNHFIHIGESNNRIHVMLCYGVHHFLNGCMFRIIKVRMLTLP